MTDPMSPEELRACRERAEAATPGPWGFKLGNLKAYVFSLDDGEDLGFSLQLQHWKDGRDVPSAENAAFIAGARTDVPRLLATNAMLETALADVGAFLRSERAKLAAVHGVLAAEGCDCDRDHHEEECDDECDHGDPCLACRIEAAMKGAASHRHSPDPTRKQIEAYLRQSPPWECDGGCWHYGPDSYEASFYLDEPAPVVVGRIATAEGRTPAEAATRIATPPSPTITYPEQKPPPSHPVQVVRGTAASPDCRLYPFSSRTCEMGTNSCTVRHGKAP